MQGCNDMHDPKVEDHRYTGMAPAGYMKKIPRHVQCFENNCIVVSKMLGCSTRNDHSL